MSRGANIKDRDGYDQQVNRVDFDHIVHRGWSHYHADLGLCMHNGTVESAIAWLELKHPLE